MQPLGSLEIFTEIMIRLWPVWALMGATFALSFRLRARLGLYGKLLSNRAGLIGLALVMFWIYAGVLAGVWDLLITHDPLGLLSGMRNKIPGTPLRSPDGQYPHVLLGADALSRDVFSRMLKGSWTVIQIAPLATLFAFMVGITLGLPAGYFSGRLDDALSFLANLILSFPVILLFYLLVTPEIVTTGLPSYMAAVLFLFPVLFTALLIHTRFPSDPTRRMGWILGLCGGFFLIYLMVISEPNGAISLLPKWLDRIQIPGGTLTVFVAVVFVNAPTVFRIVRGITMDLKTRDYVAAARTRGESAWYIMLWEILPNARAPLIVDFCLRIGYTTILLGTLGFFGLGLSPESPDWGTTINEGRKLLRVYIHPALPSALALLSLVLGLNLLADGLREESLKD